jgi:hypothetical protein
MTIILIKNTYDKNTNTYTVNIDVGPEYHYAMITKNKEEADKLYNLISDIKRALESPTNNNAPTLLSALELQELKGVYNN